MSIQITNEEKETIIKQQDFLVYFMHRNIVETTAGERPENLNVSFFEFPELLKNNIDILEHFTTDNLILVLPKLANSYLKDNENVKKYIIDLLKKRFIDGEHLLGGSDIEIDFFGAHSEIFSGANVIAKEDTEFWEEIKNKILDEYNDKKDDSRFSKIFDLLQKYVSVDNLCKCIQNGIFDNSDKINMLTILAEKNPELIKTMDFNIFKGDIYTFGIDFIEHIASYPNLSYKVVKLNENNPALFEAIIKIAEIDKEKIPLQKYEDIEILASYFSKRCFSLKDMPLNLEDLKNCAIRHWGIFDKASEIVECDYGPDYEKRYEEACNSKFVQEKELEGKKNILLIKYFSVSLKEAKKLINIYEGNINKVKHLSKDESALVFLDNIKKVIQIDDIDELENLYSNPTYQIKPDALLKFRDDIRNLYAITFSDKLFDTHSQVELAKSIEGKKIVYNGKLIDVIPLTGNFSFLIHSSDTGFKTEKKILDNDFKKTWENIPDPSTHILSTSYINQDNLGAAPVKGNGVLYAFTNLPTERIQLIGNTDINSHVRTSYYSSQNSQFVSANDIAYQTRRVYNEIAVERKDLRPDYIIVFDDSDEKVKDNSYKAALDWNIPIIYINKEKILNQQLENLETLIDLYKSTNSPQYLQELFITYETNISGWLLNKDSTYEKETYTDGIDNLRFKDSFKVIREQIMDIAKEALSTASNKEFVIPIIQTLMDEKNLYDRANDMTTPISKTEIDLDAELLISQAIANQPTLLTDIERKGYIHSAEEIKEAAKIDPEYRITNVFEIAQAIIDVEKSKENER